MRYLEAQTWINYALTVGPVAQASLEPTLPNKQIAFCVVPWVMFTNSDTMDESYDPWLSIELQFLRWGKVLQTLNSSEGFVFKRLSSPLMFVWDTYGSKTGFSIYTQGHKWSAGSSDVAVDGNYYRVCELKPYVTEADTLKVNCVRANAIVKFRFNMTIFESNIAWTP